MVGASTVTSAIARAGCYGTARREDHKWKNTHTCDGATPQERSTDGARAYTPFHEYCPFNAGEARAWNEGAVPEETPQYNTVSPECRRGECPGISKDFHEEGF